MAKQISSKIENNLLTISVEGKVPLTISGSTVNEEIREHALLHGLKQKICDAAALPNGATLTEKYLAMREVYDRLTAANATWNKIGEGTSQPSGLLFKALCRYKPNTKPEDLRAWLDKKDKKEQAAMRTKGPLVAIIEQIKLESVKTAGVDTSSLLDELDEI